MHEYFKWVVNGGVASNQTTEQAPLTGLMALLVRIERLGNRLPHPFWLFGTLSGVLALASWGLSAAGASALNPASGKTVESKNLSRATAADDGR